MNIYTEPDDPEWVNNAACRNKPTHWWHPPENQRGNNNVYDQARVICQTCPVQTQCLAHAIVHNEQIGMWGATSPHQRRHLRRHAWIRYRCADCPKWLIHPCETAGTPIRRCQQCGYQRRRQQIRDNQLWAAP